MKSKKKYDNQRPTNKEKKELYNNLKKVYDKKHINILKLRNGTKIQIKTIDKCIYNLKVVNKEKSIFFIRGNDSFFSKGDKAIIAGTIMDNVLKTYHICEVGRLEIMYKDKIIRTSMIKSVKIKGV